MPGALSRRRGGRSEEAYWPGFVDAMAQLLLVVTFLLSVFMVAQFLLAREITGQDSALGQLRSQIAELTQLLALEKAAKQEVEGSLLALQDDFSALKTKNDSLSVMLADESAKGSSAGLTISGLQTSLDREKVISSEALAFCWVTLSSCWMASLICEAPMSCSRQAALISETSSAVLRILGTRVVSISPADWAAFTVSDDTALISVAADWLRSAS